jgi:protein-disulfide isomerase
MDLYEPQIVQYYNETPTYAHIIDILNNEYNDLQNSYCDLSREFNDYKKDYPFKIIYRNTNRKYTIFYIFLFIIIFELTVIVIYV